MPKILRRILIVVGIVLGTILLLLAGIRAGERMVYASFYQNADKEFQIPGLGENYVPQGLDYIQDSKSFISCGYMSKGEASRVYLIDPNGKATYAELKETDGSDHTGHTGGVAHFDKYLYITDSDGLDVFLLEDLTSGKQDMVKVGEVKTYNDPAWCYAYGDYILAGSFYRAESYETPAEHRLTTPAGDANTSMITVFKLDATQPLGIDPTPVAAISSPDQVQGLCVTDTGEVAISTSWGFATSYIRLYDAEKITPNGTFTVGDTEVPLFYLDSASATRTIEAPPMSEEIVCLDGRLYILNESACNKYIFGKLMSANDLYSYDLKA